MKILHVCLTGPYTDGWNYQENLLTKYQKLDGHDVSIIASQWEWGEDGKIRKNTRTNYVNNVGVKIYRLAIKGDKDIFYRYKKFMDLYDCIDEIKPEIIFIHNLQFQDISIIRKYAKKNQVTLFADNHADFSNSARSTFAKIFYKTVWRHYAKSIEPFVTKFYGVLPARVEFLKEVFKLPKDKCELLVMGADDDEVERTSDSLMQIQIRKSLGYGNEDFVVVTGGKIDSWKRQTLLLMEAIRKIENKNIKLLVFGPVSDDVKDEFNKLCDCKQIKYIKWANIEESYNYFAIADLVVFPGRHSVYWEQVAGQGKPMLCKYWEGTTHVDLGGNVEFLREDSVDEIYQKIVDITTTPNKYEKMKEAAEGKNMEVFSYKNIAKRCIS